MIDNGDPVVVPNPSPGLLALDPLATENALATGKIANIGDKTG